MTRHELLPSLRTERIALVEMLLDVPDEVWDRPSLCVGWTVHDVLAHLTAAARTPTFPWMANMAASRFDTNRHNQRLLARYRRADPAETLTDFRAAAPSAAAPFGELEAALGEIVVHSQDIARPLNRPLVPACESLQVVADFFARKDFAVNSRTLVRGLRLEATDDGFGTGEGPVLRGPLLALVMVMAGRTVTLGELEGDGVDLLRDRLPRP